MVSMTSKAKRSKRKRRCGRVDCVECDYTLSFEQRKFMHPPAQTKEETRWMRTLIARLRYRGYQYDADIAEMEVLSFISSII